VFWKPLVIKYFELKQNQEIEVKYHITPASYLPNLTAPSHTNRSQIIFPDSSNGEKKIVINLRLQAESSAQAAKALEWPSKQSAGRQVSRARVRAAGQAEHARTKLGAGSQGAWARASRSISTHSVVVFGKGILTWLPTPWIYFAGAHS
jgi:hypothetical protein